MEVEGICSIINQCAVSGVESLTYGGLSLKFAQNPNQVVYAAPPGMKEAEVIPALSYEREDELSEEFRKADLILSDPAQYEQEMVDSFINSGPRKDLDVRREKGQDHS